MSNIPIDELIKKTARELKKIKEIKPPEWSKYCKTGTHKQRPPVNKDWWYIRSASVLRKTAILGPIGVSKLKRKYGGKKNRGHKPERFYKGSGSIARKILQQLEKAELVTKSEKKTHKGRVITQKGSGLLNSLSKNGKSKREAKKNPTRTGAPTTDPTTRSNS